ncbi:MAG: N-acetylneuraminate synthase family protein [Bacteroidales bacterium]|nr:N-acetylneuraminate synthase family protein [Bacteroidales bacterium]
MDYTYIIGEIGQNHNGSTELAKSIIDIISIEVIDEFSGITLKSLDAIKLTKRDLNEELSASAMNKAYDNPNSFGKTYGEHRKYLELNNEEHFEIYKYAKSKGLEVIETLCSIGTLGLLKLFIPDKLKVASRDLTNLPLLDAMAETKIPIILSTGMGGQKELDDALNIISKHHSDISILHCLSQYPAQYNNINLKTINYLIEKYPEYTIGYSDHSIGISIPLAAVSMGAKIIEKHITLDRRLKGTDHKGSLGIDGLNRMVRDIRNLERAMGEKDIFSSEKVISAKIKLERSIASNRIIKKGEKIHEKDIHLLSPGDGFKYSMKDKVIGKIAKEDIPKNEIIYPSMI